MRVPRFFCPTPLAGRDTLQLDGQSAHHLLRVLRRRSGDPVCLFDGQGGEYRATVHNIQRHSVELHINDFNADNRESALHTHLGLAVSKGERMDWAIQKCTELGISAITPLITERCAVQLNRERQDKKTGHWQRIACSACEQCGRNVVPDINSVTTLDDWLSRIDTDLSLVCDGQGDDLIQLSHTPDHSPASLAILVGPEGGLTAHELHAAQQTGFHLTRVGPRILRTETAPVAVLSIAQYLWGDLNSAAP